MFDKLSAMPNQTATNIEERRFQLPWLYSECTRQKRIKANYGRLSRTSGSAENMASSHQESESGAESIQIENTNEDEVYVSNLKLPEKKSISVIRLLPNVEVTSNVSGSATLYLYSGRSLKGRTKFSFKGCEYICL